MVTLAALLPLMALVAQTSAPNGPVWRWDREFTGCGLVQNIDDRTLLEIERTPGSDDTRFGIKPTKPITASRKVRQGGSLAFQPAGAIGAEATIADAYDGRREIDALSRDPDALDKFGASSELEFKHQETGVLRLPIREAKSAVEALRICEDGKMRDWGIDPLSWRALAVKPKPQTPPESWFSYLDYPDREKIYKNDITVAARLDLGADGLIQKCIAVNDPPKEFAGAVCDALRRKAKLQPARDAAGNGVPAPYVMFVTFGAFPL